MIRAYYLYTGEDGNSHVARGSVSASELVEAESILFKENSAPLLVRLAQRPGPPVRHHTGRCPRVYHRGG